MAAVSKPSGIQSINTLSDNFIMLQNFLKSRSVLMFQTIQTYEMRNKVIN